MALFVLGLAFTCAGSCFFHVEFYVVRYLFFLLKKSHTLCFYCIITLFITPSRGFSS